MLRLLLLILCLIFLLNNNGFSFLPGDLKNNEIHQSAETIVANYDLDQIQKLQKSTLIAWVINPKLRLTKEDIKTLVQNNFKILKAEGKWTLGNFEVIEGKEHLVFLYANDKDGLILAQERVGNQTEDYQFFQCNQALLIDKGELKNGAFEFFYRWPGDSQKNKIVKLRFTNIFVKNPDTPLGQYIKNQIEKSFSVTPIAAKNVNNNVVDATKPPIGYPTIIEAAPPLVPDALNTPSPVIVSSTPYPGTVLIPAPGQPSNQTTIIIENQNPSFAVVPIVPVIIRR